MQPKSSTAERAAAYWDANREKSKDPAYWMAHPICREAINRRVAGSPHEWPLDWFKRVHVQTPFERGVSWGCGLGAFERSAIRTGIVKEIDAFDLSQASLADARRLAEEEGLTGIHYAAGNFDDPKLSDGAYDAVFFHQSLHHVSKLERLFRAISMALVPGGAVYVDEYVGPSRDQWTKRHLNKAQNALERLPAIARIPKQIALPIEEHDPSEAVRSGEIADFLREYLDLVEWRPYGGQIASLVFPYLRPEWVSSEEGSEQIRAMLELEDEDLRQDPSSTHYLVAYGRLRPKRPLSRQLFFRLRRLF